MAKDEGRDPRYARGAELYAAGDAEAALDVFEEILREDGASAPAHLWRGACWFEAGELQLALEDVDRALELDPSYAAARSWRGKVLLARGEAEASLDEYDAAIAIAVDDERARVLEGRARALSRIGEWDRALADIDAWIAERPELAHAHVARATTLQQLERGDEALAALDEALRLEPDDEHARALRASMLAERGEIDAEYVEWMASQALDEKEDAPMGSNRRTVIASLLQEHFKGATVADLTITEREYPYRMRADLHRSVQRMFADDPELVHFSGVLKQYDHSGLDLASLMAPNPHDPAHAAPPRYEEMDVGDAEPVRCLQNGLWLLGKGAAAHAVLLAAGGQPQYGNVTGLKIAVAARAGEEGARRARDLFERLAEAVKESASYRGKILSLESAHRFAGESSGIQVHRLKTVAREDVILPATTLELLDRNILGFVRQRARLASFGLPLKKGLLFYGPPGTGKTHTVHYLAGALKGHTTLLITAEQVGLLPEYMQLARLLQPSIVVIEDVDLVGTDRDQVDAGCGSVVLHALLNEMDGLRQDAEVLFILTTNRPQVLETALASRPGRVDQAIEFPLPDDAGRAKLLRLYSRGLQVSDDLIASTVRKTDRVSASFIKELMRRSAQFQLERDESAPALTSEDVDNALEELLITGGSLNRKLLGALDADAPDGE